MRNTLTLAAAGLAFSGAAFAQTQVTPTPVSTPLRAVKTSGLGNPAAGGALLFDNGGPDGVNGYSNATVGAFGARRTLLDDFTVPAGETWNVGCLEWNSVWNSFPAGSGTGAEIEIYNEASTGGAPDTTSSASGGLVNVCSYDEIGTGAVFFSRPEAISTANFDTITLGAGTYWIDGTIIGGENNFWLTAGGGALNGSECYVDYDDLGGLQPGSAIFGVVSDLAWKLSEGDCTNDRITVYCNPGDGSPNNTASISVSGNVLDGSDIDVCMTGGPAGQSAYLLVGNNNGIVNAPPGAKGDLCIVGGFIGRYALDIATLDVNGGTCVNLRQNAQTTGCPDYTVPNTGCAQQYQPGETWYFQFWHRQPMGQASTFSEAACVTFK